MADGKPATIVEAVGRTDVGQLREHNEDAYVLVRLDSGSRDEHELHHHELGARGTLLVVCDGMGGAAAGEVASSMAIETTVESMLKDTPAAAPDGVVDDALATLGRTLRRAAQEANTQIHREA